MRGFVDIGRRRRLARRTRPRSNVPASSSNVSEPSTRRTSAVVTDGRYSIAPRSPSRSSPARNRKRTRALEVAVAFGGVGLAFERVGVLGFGCSRVARAARRRVARDAVGPTRRPAAMTSATTRERDRRATRPDGTASKTSPIQSTIGAQPVAEPLQRPAERARRGIGAEAAVAEDVARVCARGVGVDGLTNGITR